MVYVLRKEVPEDLVNRLLLVVGIHGINDTHEIRHAKLNGDVEQLLAELFPYYIPCFGRKHLVKDISVIQYMTILRQVLRQKNRKLVSRETHDHMQSLMVYRIDPGNVYLTKMTNEPPNFEMTFE